MSDHIEWETLDRYFSGTLSPAEGRAIARWAASDPEHEKYLASVRRVWEEAAADAGRFDANVAWRAMQERVAASAGTTPRSVRTRTLQLYPAATGRAARPRRPYLRLAAAAALILAVGASAVWYSAAAPQRARREAAALPMREYATATGQRAEILLSDGTRALLSVESHLRVPADYGGGARDVYLDGEAFFDVRHDELKPFRVHIRGGIAEDLGTEFVVRAYPDDSGATVVVASGLVALRVDSAHSQRAPAATAIRPGQLGRLDASGRVTVIDDVDVRAHLSWTRGRIAFRDVPFARVAHELERWYDVEIEIADSSLARAPLVASFDNQPLDDVLRIVSRSLDASYTRQGRIVRFSARSSPR